MLPLLLDLAPYPSPVIRRTNYLPLVLILAAAAVAALLIVWRIRKRKLAAQAEAAAEEAAAEELAAAEGSAVSGETPGEAETEE